MAALRRPRRRRGPGARHPLSAGRVHLRLHRCPLLGVGGGLRAGAVGRRRRGSAAPAPAGAHARARDARRARRRGASRCRRRLGAAAEPGGGGDQRSPAGDLGLAPARGNDPRGHRRAHVRGGLRSRRARSARRHRAGDRRRWGTRGARLDCGLVPGTLEPRARTGGAGARRARRAAGERAGARRRAAVALRPRPGRRARRRPAGALRRPVGGIAPAPARDPGGVAGRAGAAGQRRRALNVHRRRPRYRVCGNGCVDLFGEALDDPDARFWLEVALRVGDGRRGPGPGQAQACRYATWGVAWQAGAGSGAPLGWPFGTSGPSAPAAISSAHE